MYTLSEDFLRLVRWRSEANNKDATSCYRRKLAMFCHQTDLGVVWYGVCCGCMIINPVADDGVYIVCLYIQFITMHLSVKQNVSKFYPKYAKPHAKTFQ